MHFSGKAVWLAASLFVSSACVTQRQYDDAVEFGRNQQTLLHEREQTIAQLEADRDRMRRDMAANGVSALSEAGYGGDLESRLSELQSKIDGLGRPMGDIERIDVTGGYVLLVQDRILFGSGSSDLSDEGKKSIQRIADEIEKAPHGRLQVRGHTDSDRVVKPATLERFPHGNLQLSAARAVEVAAALISTKRVDSKDVTVAGFGPYEPIKPNDNPENKRLNRRVEIFVADRSAPTATPAGK
ncbi:MAG: OmpA family protein [Planctomycetota bacterium]|nr:OmpA family protein [Planctomycetota bacterium]